MDKFIPREVMVEAVAPDLVERDEVLQQHKFPLGRAQDYMIRHANAHRAPSRIKGDWVFLKIRPYRQVSMPNWQQGFMVFIWW